MPKKNFIEFPHLHKLEQSAPTQKIYKNMPKYGITQNIHTLYSMITADDGLWLN